MEAAFFDLDKTVIDRASMVAFGRSFYRRGLISRSLILRALWAQLVYLHLGASEEKLARIRESVLALTKGWVRDHVAEVVADTLEQVIDPIIYAEAAELIEHHRREGRLVCIVSASPAEIVEPLARHLGADRAIATRARLDDEGRYTGAVEFYAYGPHKVEAMQDLAGEMGIDLTGSYAYSDSATDIPMLSAVGHPVAVNPDRDLLRAARERGWEVRNFVRPVRLRDRVPVPPAKPTAAALVGGAAVGVSVLVWPRRRAVAYAVRNLRAAAKPRATKTPSRRILFMRAA